MAKAQILDAMTLTKAVEIGLYIAFLIYLDKLEKVGCECALNWRRKFILAFIVVALAWTVASLVTTPFNNMYLVMGLAFFRLAFIVVAIQYVNKLKKDKCECSQEWTRDVMYYYAWIGVILTALSFALVAWAFAVAYSQ